MTGLEMQDLDFFDEEYLGPPPRFLVEDAQPVWDRNSDGASERENNRPIERLKSFFDNWLG